MKTPGQVAYEAYYLHSDGKSLVSGAELLSWEKLDPKIAAAWEAAGNAAAAYCIAMRT